MPATRHPSFSVITVMAGLMQTGGEISPPPANFSVIPVTAEKFWPLGCPGSLPGQGQGVVSQRAAKGGSHTLPSPPHGKASPVIRSTASATPSSLTRQPGHIRHCGVTL